MVEEVKVSVIVPIYKVENYIRRCIDSIIQQTYRHLEIILVDDGSPDSCGAIADEYCQLDKRVKVIHKENGGLSDARNHGMQEVTGDFVMYVDSDDWISERMVETLIRYQKEYQADIVQSAFYYAYEDKLLFDNRYFHETDSPMILGNKALMHELVVNERIKNFAWEKLYKANLIRNIPFKKGVLFEDVFWAHQVMSRVNRYVMVHQPMYYYLQREDSIVAAFTPRNLDIIEGLKERHEFIRENYRFLIQQSFKGLLKASFIHYGLLFRNKKQDPKKTYRKEIQTYIQSNYVELCQAVKDDKELSRQLDYFILHPKIYLLHLAWRSGLRKIGFVPSRPVLKQVEW